ncbi:hypothetical protein [Rothia sp. CCM 9419]|uniref:hypothetical protein n=1 Tax=Rothia sp. CCM 9419 TaxID=3402662 RepID=UPI003ADCA960
MQTNSSLTKVTRYTAVAALAAALVGAPAIAPTYSLSGNTAIAQETPATKTLSVSSTADSEGKITVIGSGFISAAEGRGAVVALKFDAGGVNNLEPVVHPLTGQKIPNKTVNFVVVAEEDGSFEAKVPLPSPANSTVDEADWAEGTTHNLTALVGSLGAQDVPGNAMVDFTVAYAPQDTEDQSSWTHLQVGDAQLNIRPYTTGEKMRITGTGWLKENGAEGSVVVLKLESSSDGTFYERPDNSAQAQYLGSLGLFDLGNDHTAWMLVMPDAQQVNEEKGISLVKPDGSFDITFDVPEALKNGSTGQYLAVQALSGRFAPGDTRRSAKSQPIPVNGVAAQPPQKEEPTEKCVSSETKPSAHFEKDTVAPGGTLHLLGKGWCNENGAGAARLAIKIDDAAISRLDTSVHSNKTIWTIVDANPTTGEIDAHIQLPKADGSDSSPALTEGAHSLRLLSGSLKAGDINVSYGGPGVLDFIVGAYSPTTMPDVLSDSELTAQTQNEVTVKESQRKVTVHVPHAQPRQWVHVTPYIDGSSRATWSSGWVQLDDNRTMEYTLEEGLPAGHYKMVVQDGEQATFGQLLGWAGLEYTTNEQKNSAQTPATEHPHMPMNPEHHDSATGGENTKNGTVPATEGSSTQHHTGAATSSLSRATYNNASAPVYSPVPNSYETIAVAPPKKVTRIVRAASLAQAAQTEKTAQAQKNQREDARKKTVAAPSPTKKASAPASPAPHSSPAIASTEATVVEKSFWDNTASVNNLLLIGAGIVLLGAVAIPRKKPLR